MNETRELEFQPSTIETIDFAVYEWLNEKMNIQAYTNEGWRKVPILWTSAERAHQIKNNKDIRDSSGMLIYPLITLERTSINKDPQKRGAIPANIRDVNDEKGGTITVSRRIQQEKTSNFENANLNKLLGANQNVKRQFYRSSQNRTGLYELRDQRAISGNKTVYETITIPIPVHVNVTYNIFLKSEYLQQMNEMITPFFTRNGNTKSIILNKDNHRFEAFMNGDFAQDNNFSQLNEERKVYGSKITLEVLGRLIGSNNNQDKPKIIIRENAVEYKFPRESIVFQDEIEGLDLNKNKRKYVE
jgi:hypothetical protein